MKRRRLLATLLLPLALVALLVPLHVHHGPRHEPTTAMTRHACDCGPGESVPVLAGPHLHGAPELCWLPHQSAIPARLARPPVLVRLPPPSPVGQETSGIPVARQVACRGPPPLLA